MGLLREVRLVLALSLTAVPAVARADAELAVTSREGAADCPDAVEVRRLVLAAVGPSPSPPAHAYHVSFERSEGAYRAEIVDDTAGRARRLEDRGPGCGPLGQAAAEVVATMWSSERDVTPAPAPAPLPVPPSAVPVTSPPGPRRARWAFGGGAAVAVGLVRPVAPALFGEGSVELSHASLGLGALWIPGQRLAVAPGSVDVQLLAGSLRGCVFAGDGTHLGLCAKLLFGALRAEGSGYSEDTQRTRPWFAIGPEAYADHALAAWVRCRAAVGAIVPLHAETFSVAGAGSAYATPVLGGLASLSLEIVAP